MKLYKLGVFLVVLICVFALVFSYLTWQDKLENVLQKPEEAQAQSTDIEKKEPAPAIKADSANFDELTINMDDQVKELFSNRKDSDNSLKMLIAGSAALESGTPSYAEQLESALEAAYSDFIEVDVFSIAGTSESLATVDLSAGYDLVLLEPMTLMNNGLIAIEQEREHVQEFEAALTAKIEDAVLVLHPPQPIYGAGYYLSQVAALDEFAATNGYAYIDHWSAWLNTDNEELKDYLTEDGLPNDKGAGIWADELEAYFIAD